MSDTHKRLLIGYYQSLILMSLVVAGMALNAATPNITF